MFAIQQNTFIARTNSYNKLSRNALMKPCCKTNEKVKYCEILALTKNNIIFLSHLVISLFHITTDHYIAKTVAPRKV